MESINPKTKHLLSMVNEQQADEWGWHFISKGGFSRPDEYQDEDDEDLGWNSEELDIIKGLEAIAKYRKHMAAGRQEEAEAFLPRIEASTPILRWWIGLDKTFPVEVCDENL